MKRKWRRLLPVVPLVLLAGAVVFYPNSDKPPSSPQFQAALPDDKPQDGAAAVKTAH